MMKRFIFTICIVAIFFASPAFAYKKDVQSREETTGEEGVPEQPQPYEVPQQVHEGGGGGGEGVVVAGYIMTGLGGAAAITGSTLAVATDKRLAGAIIGATGAALGLAGSLMIMFGSSHYGYSVAPEVDPARGVYGLGMSGSF